MFSVFIHFGTMIRDSVIFSVYTRFIYRKLHTNYIKIPIITITNLDTYPIDFSIVIVFFGVLI